MLGRSSRIQTTFYSPHPDTCSKSNTEPGGGLEPERRSSSENISLSLQLHVFYIVSHQGRERHPERGRKEFPAAR